MKKIIILLVSLLFCNNIYAIEKIKINDEELSPIFSSNITAYNYYTNENQIIIEVKSSKNEKVSGYGVFTLESDYKKFEITSSKYGKYYINVFKNYKESSERKLINLEIENYEINFKENVYDYYITIENEDHLNIKYELSNDDTYLSIIGNGNLSEKNNLIKINVNNDKEYKIHISKSKTVFKEAKSTQQYKELSENKKEIIKISIIIISSICIGLFYLFIRRI